MTPNAPSEDHVTVLLFKDNLTARAFEVPLRWMTRVGLLLGFLGSMTLISMIAAGRYYWISLKTNPARVEDLEQEISQLRLTLHDFELRANTSTPAIAATPVATSSPVTLPISTATSSPSPTAPTDLNPSCLGFLAFPPTAKMTLPDPTTLTFDVKTPKAQWSGNTLKVRFYLQYTKGDEGSQQGKILVIARGPELLMGYPNGILNPSGAKSLIEPERGEFFSVSRYREVKADFATARSKSIHEVEIYLFSKSDELLFYQKIIPQSHHHGPSSSPVETQGSTDENPT